jgi:hypothetical protein
MLETMDRDNILALLKRNRSSFELLGVKRIGIFGSRVAGTPGSGSDIDILVEFEKGRKTFDNYMDLKARLEGMFAGYAVDLVIQDTLKPGLRAHVLSAVQYAS